VIAEPFTSTADLERLSRSERRRHRSRDPNGRPRGEELEATNTPLIGFAGAPFTVASYLVEAVPPESSRASRP